MGTYAYWYEEFEKEVIEIDPELRGRINWDAAYHLLFLGHSPTSAAEVYTKD